MYMQLQEVLKLVREAYDRYEFSNVYNAVNNFVSTELFILFRNCERCCVY